jgi:anti-anti-sigma factor
MASIKLEEKDTYKIMHLEGDFVGGEETDDLRAQLMKNGKVDKNFVIVDLSKVVYLSSASLSVFISSDAFYKRYKGKMVLYKASDYIKKIFDITKLHFAVTICVEEDEAVKALNH